VHPPSIKAAAITEKEIMLGPIAIPSHIGKSVEIQWSKTLITVTYRAEIAD
jgi:hypothetical protein